MLVQQMPIFTRTYDFLTWLLPVTNNFPRARRFTITNRPLRTNFKTLGKISIFGSKLSQFVISTGAAV